ncbi:MAG: phosphatase PAP2 family protein [Flavobacteriales bacterium]|nr:phosphatase PAP2 family protein [Flavobacteriales bacterium]MCC6939491.1 phosphatase PAP2 family protein [Flavobacteriales bacterium]
MSIWQQLDAFDRSAFLAINGTSAPWADALMLTVSNMVIWFPLYAFLLFVIQRRSGWPGLAWAVPTIALMILFSDKGSVLLFKESVQRLRPCYEPALAGLVHLVPEGCGGQYGFVSSHATNHFAIAVFMIGVLRGTPRWAAPALIGWATLIAYSRVYLGVHYPGDVLVGALYGIGIGTIFTFVFRRIQQRFLST